MQTSLPPIRRLVAVCAHPDDESFGLGAMLAVFAAAGTEIALLCFTRGEASTLGMEANDLAAVRTRELTAATAVLGISNLTLLDYPDGGLADVRLEALVAHVAQVAVGADAFLVFDEGGITGHPDHMRATAAACAVAARTGLPVYAWAISLTVATALNEEFGAAFVGREVSALDICLHVDREPQLRAVACHRSQSSDNPVLWRRLALMGDREYLRVLSCHRSIRSEGQTIAKGEQIHAHSTG